MYPKIRGPTRGGQPYNLNAWKLCNMEAARISAQVRWIPHPVTATIRDNRDYIGSSYIRNIPLLQGGGVLLESRNGSRGCQN